MAGRVNASLSPPPPLPADASLFLDFDGTLVELADTPDAVHAVDHLLPLLGRLRDRLDGRVAIVSGRAVDWMRGVGLGNHTLSGTHGGELMMAGQLVERPDRPAGLDRAADAFAAFAVDRPGIVVEHKELGTGLHYRLAQEHGEAANALATAWGQRTGLAVQPGKMMVELRLPGGSKGTAVEALMEREPFSGGVPIFLGDDVTDEDGFSAARSAGGFGVLVGPARDTNAAHRLPDVDAVHDWLAGEAA